MLAKLIGGALSYAPRKIIIDGKTIFNPTDTLLKEQGYKDVETAEAPEISTQTQQAVPTWQEQENKIVQSWEVKPAQPDPSVALQEIQTQAVLAQIAESEDKTLGIQCMALFSVWKRGNYVVGDVRTDPDTGYPYECIVAHDSITNTEIPETIGRLKTELSGRHGTVGRKNTHFRGRNRKPGHLEYITLVNI